MQILGSSGGWLNIYWIQYVFTLLPWPVAIIDRHACPGLIGYLEYGPVLKRAIAHTNPHTIIIKTIINGKKECCPSYHG